MKRQFLLLFQLVYFFVFCQDNPNLIDTRDGNIYQTVNIGAQKWMSENLNTDRFVNGEKIPEVKSFKAWISASN